MLNSLQKWKLNYLNSDISTFFIGTYFMKSFGTTEIFHVAIYFWNIKDLIQVFWAYDAIL